MTQFVRFGTFNAVLPKEGPKTYPFNLDFSTKGTQVLDFQIEIDGKHISFVSGFFADNRANGADLVVTSERIGHAVRIPAGKQGFMPLFVGDSPVIDFVTTPAAGLIVPVFVCNFPLSPYIF
jgi:hypothetical protein